MNDTTEVWTPLLFILSFNTALTCIQYGFEFARWIWKKCINNFTSDGNGHRATPGDLKRLRLKLESEKAIDQHVSKIMSREEGVQLKKLRMCWVKWSQSHEDEFQSLLNNELLRSLTGAELQRLDALTIARKMHIEEDRKKP